MADCKIPVKVTPNAPREKVGPWKDGELLVRVGAPAVDNKANEAVCDAVAEALGVTARAVAIERGGTSRHKLLRVAGFSLDEAKARLERR